MFTTLLALTFVFASIPVTESACQDCPGCTPISVGASGTTAGYSTRVISCNDASYTPIVTSVDVTDADSDGDGFKITLMDKDNYEKYTKGQSYQYYDISGTGPDHSYTCFHSGTISARLPAGQDIYIVIYCTNILQKCNLMYKVDVTCQPPSDPCSGINCNHGTCVSGTCSCDSGYSGIYCDQKDCPSSCNHGTCVNGACQCDFGYTGSTCNEQSCVGVNCNNGRCSNGKCFCYSGYTGPACDTPTSIVPTCDCGSHGYCNDNGGCTCFQNYYGSNCQYYSNGFSSTSSDSTALVIGLATGGAALFIIIVAVVGTLLYRRRRRRQAGDVTLISNEVVQDNRVPMPGLGE